MGAVYSPGIEVFEHLLCIRHDLHAGDACVKSKVLVHKEFTFYEKVTENIYNRIIYNVISVFDFLINKAKFS